MKSRRSSAVAALIPSTFFSEFTANFAERFARPQSFLSNVASRFNRRRLSNLSWKKYLPLLLLIVIVVGILAVVGGIIPSLAKSGDQRIEMKGALATVPVARTLQIPVRDNKGALVTNTAYTIETAELRDEIIVQGRRMVAIKGRVFLILTIKMVNEYSKELEIKAADYVRLSVGGNETELLAPDIHNDPVRVQAISTKYTRVGFPIYDTDRSVTLYIGEISGDKERVPLQF